MNVTSVYSGILHAIFIRSALSVKQVYEQTVTGLGYPRSTSTGPKGGRQRRREEANAASISKGFMSCWLNTVEDRSPPPEKKEKVEEITCQFTDSYASLRITSCKLPAALLKLMSVHAIAFISNFTARMNYICTPASLEQ